VSGDADSFPEMVQHLVSDKGILHVI
jgi:hypothetical protein